MKPFHLHHSLFILLAAVFTFSLVSCGGDDDDDNGGSGGNGGGTTPTEKFTVKTEPATDISATTAMLHAKWETNYTPKTVNYYFRVSESPSPTASNSEYFEAKQSGDNAFSAKAFDLKKETTYYFRAYANVDGKVIEGDVQSFTTKSFRDAPVDLGLSVRWAACNIGADAPEEWGGHYAWGEVITYSNYAWAIYKWSQGSQTTLTKYNTNSTLGTVDNRTTLLPVDDVAYRLWGSSWRMPTEAEWKELMDKCDWARGEMNGTKGFYVTSRTNGNKIFLPAAGEQVATQHDGTDNGFYWSSTLRSSLCYDAMTLVFQTEPIHVGIGAFKRYVGLSVRAVCE